MAGVVEYHVDPSTAVGSPWKGGCGVGRGSQGRSAKVWV